MTTPQIISKSKKIESLRKEWNAKFLIKPMTLDEQRRLLDKTKTNQVEAMVDLIVMKCLMKMAQKLSN